MGNLEELNLNSRAAAVINLDDGVILAGLNENQTLPIASLTKIMTAYLAAERLDPATEITITPEMVNIAPEFVTAGLYVGEIISVEELLHLTLLPSAGDAAQALAIAAMTPEYTNQSTPNSATPEAAPTSDTEKLDAFISLMNSTATEWGMTNTHFSNTYGLDADNYSTASDLAKMFSHAIKNATFKKVFETNHYTSPTTGKTWDKTVAATATQSATSLDPISGAKTGYTEAAGRCLGSTALLSTPSYFSTQFSTDFPEQTSTPLPEQPSEQNQTSDRTPEHPNEQKTEQTATEQPQLPGNITLSGDPTNLAVITLDANDSLAALLDTKSIYDYYQTNYARQLIASTGRALATLEVRGAKNLNSYEITQPENVVRYLPLARNDIEVKWSPAVDAITNDLALGSTLGTVSYLLDGEELYSFTPTLDLEIEYINYPLITTAVSLTTLAACFLLFKFVRRR